MTCQRQPVMVWTGVTHSIITKSRQDDEPSTSAVDADTFATAWGCPRMSEMISGAINTKGITRSTRKNHTPIPGSARLRLRTPPRVLAAIGGVAAARARAGGEGGG